MLDQSMGDVRKQWVVLFSDRFVWRIAWEQETGRPCVYTTRSKARFARDNAKMADAAVRRERKLVVAQAYQVLVPIYGALGGMVGVPVDRLNARDLVMMAEPYLDSHRKGAA
jgi:hypothetical protein